MSTSPVTPKIVQVPGVGNIQFPGDMPDDQVSAAIKKNYFQLTAPNNGLAGVARPRVDVQPIDEYDPAKDKSLTDLMGHGMPTQEDLTPSDVAHPRVAHAVTSAIHALGLPATGEEASQMVTQEANKSFTDKLKDAPIAGPFVTVNTLKAAGKTFKQAGHEQMESAQAAARGDIPGATAHQAGAIGYGAAAALTPVGGQNMVTAGEQFGKGDVAGGIGTTIGTIAPFVLGDALKAPAADAAEGVKAITGKTAQLPARSLSSILGGGPEAMQKRPITQQTAAGAASNAEVAQYAQQHGIDLLPGQATQARGLKTVQAIGERSVVAPGVLPDVLERQKANFGNLVDDFKSRVGTDAIKDTESAGQSLKSQAQAGLDKLKNSAQADYQAFQKQVGDLPVDLNDVKAKYAQKLADQAEALKNVPAEYSGPVRNVLNKLAGLEGGPAADPRVLADFHAAVDSYGLNSEQQIALRQKLGLPAESGSAAVSMNTAQQLRSAYLDIARDYSGNIPKAVQRLASEAAKDIDGAMASAADKAGATKQWRQANSKWKQLQETYNNPDHPLYKVLQESDATKVPSRLLGKGNYGGSPQTVRQMKQAGIDLAPLKREVAQQITDKNFALTNGGRGMAGYSTPFLQELFEPAEFEELTKMGRVGRAINFEMNPSGTSNVQQGERQLHGIIHRTAGAVIGPLASKLTTSKALARAAMPGLDTTVAPPRGLLQIIGKPAEPPPDLPPASGTPVTPTQGPVSPVPMAKGVAATEERGIKAPQKRTFARSTDQDVKDFFSYRFDQLRGEMKEAKATGNQAAVEDVQRRMNELDQIQRNPQSLKAIMAGKPPQRVNPRSLSDIINGEKSTAKGGK